MRLLYKNFIYEAISKGQDLYLGAGTTLFHGTGETIEGELRPGGYYVEQEMRRIYGK